MVFIFLTSLPALAEYRAYQYLVKTNDQYAVANKAQAQYVTTSMNPQTFKSFHGGSYVSVDMLRTWICPGYTGKQVVCEHPYDKAVTK